MIFLLANWRWLVPTALAAFLSLWLGWTKLELANLKASQAIALAKAVAAAAAEQKRADTVSLDFVNKESSDQAKETVKTVTITKWAYKNVEVVANCPSPALVRLHDAAATGADPESIVYAARELNGPSQAP